MESSHERSKCRLTYRELDAWKQSRKLAVSVFKACERLPLSKNWGLCDQMRRSAVSIPSNLAEGDERGTNKDALRFFFISKGSLAELRTQIDIAHETGNLSKEDFRGLENQCELVEKLLGGLIRRRMDFEKSVQR